MTEQKADHTPQCIRFDGRGYGLRSPEKYRVSLTLVLGSELHPFAAALRAQELGNTAVMTEERTLGGVECGFELSQGQWSPPRRPWAAPRDRRALRRRGGGARLPAACKGRL